MNNDILLDSEGDMLITEAGDIQLVDSLRQKVEVTIRWCLGEWQWDKEEGLPWFTELVGVKNPNLRHFKTELRSKLFDITEVAEVKQCDITIDAKARTAKVVFVVVTDSETLKGEVSLDG